MEDNNNHNEWIDAYFDGDLSVEELDRFKRKLKDDKDFEREVNAQKMVRDSIKRAELKDFFAEVNDDYNKNNNGRGFFTNFTFMAIAASIILLIGVGLFILNREAVVTQPQMYIAQSFTLEVTAEGGLRAVAEEIFVQVIENTTYDFYYSFTDGVLKLYFKEVEISSEDIDIFYDMFSAQPYEIEISGVRYGMVETDDETPLPLVEKRS